MSLEVAILYLTLALFILFWPFRRIWLNKEVWVKRINPANLSKYGDVLFNDDTFYIRCRWTTRIFNINALQKVRVYSVTNWGLNDNEQVCISFPKLKIILDAEDEASQVFSKELLQKLNIEKELYWGLLPRLNDSMKRDVIYSRH